MADPAPVPLHDWTRVEDDVWHSFHTGLVAGTSGRLNRGTLPGTHYVMIEPQTGPPPDGIGHGSPRRIVVKRDAGGPPEGDIEVASVEFVHPLNRQDAAAASEFVDRLEKILRGGVHVLLIDLFPPAGLLPGGMHGAVADRFDVRYDPPPGEPLTFASYRSAGDETTEFVEPRAVGAAVPTMPLFLTADRYVNVPLADSYAAAYGPTPAKFRRVLEAGG